MDDELVLITHSGIFHADDVLSTVLLRWLFEDRLVDIMRVPDVEAVIPNFDKNAMYQTLPDGRKAIVYDTGKGRFDHHQPGSPRRPTGQKYSSFGLLWNAYGKRMLAERFRTKSKDDILLLHKNIDKSFVINIDAYDNGESCPATHAAFSRIISKLNPSWTEVSQEACDRRFKIAVDVAEELLDSVCRDHMAQIEAVSVVLSAVQKAVPRGQQFIVLDRYAPYDRTLTNNPSARGILFVVYPSVYTEGEWCVGTVANVPGRPGCRKSLPSILRGREKSELMKYNWTFVHPSGFLGSALTKQDAIKLAAYAVQYVEPEDQEDDYQGGDEN